MITADDGDQPPDAAAARALKRLQDAVSVAAEDLAPAAAVSAVTEIAREGMDPATRLVLRAYIKKHHLMPVEDFETLSTRGTPPDSAAQPHTPT